MRPSVPAAIRQRLIDPMVDFVFKKLLGSEENKNILILFLNAVLQRSVENQVVEVTLINPYNEKDTAKDKLTIVDVKARDQQGHIFQVEVQLQAHDFLTERMLFTWAQLYAKQLHKGKKYEQLKPVTSIWLVRETVFPEVLAYAHRAQMQDPQTGIVLDTTSGIHILEVSKWSEQGLVLDPRDEWLKFFWEGSMMELETLSERLSPELGKAVDVLRSIREQEEDYYRYLSRLDYQRTQATIQAQTRRTKQQLKEAEKALVEKEQALSEKDQALVEKDQALVEKDQALVEKVQALEAERQESARKDQALAQKEQALEAERKEKERLQALLRSAGIAP